MSDGFVGAALLIVGVTGGIGSALARRLAKSGAHLALAARTPETLESLARETGGIPIRMDATQPAEVDAAIARALAEYSRLDGVAHCVGSLLLKPAHSTSNEEQIIFGSRRSGRFGRGSRDRRHGLFGNTE